MLRHIARYALTLRPVLDSLFYQGLSNGCESDLSQLRANKLITAVENAALTQSTLTLATVFIN